MPSWKKRILKLVFSPLNRKERRELGAKVIKCPCAVDIRPIHIDRIPPKVKLSP